MQQVTTKHLCVSARSLTPGAVSATTHRRWRRHATTIGLHLHSLQLIACNSYASFNVRLLFISHDPPVSLKTSCVGVYTMLDMNRHVVTHSHVWTCRPILIPMCAHAYHSKRPWVAFCHVLQTLQPSCMIHKLAYEQTHRYCALHS